MAHEAFNKQIAEYIEIQREYSRRLAANEPAETLADLKEALDDMEATFNFFDAHGNKLTGEGLVKLVDGMQNEYARTLVIKSPFIFVGTNDKPPQVFAMNAKSTGAGPSGEVKLTIDPKPLTEDYYNEKYRPDDLKFFEKPKEPGFFARVYNWFHKQFNDGLESDTFRAYNKAVHKYEVMHHFHTREIQPKNNGKMNCEMDNVPEMPDRTKMSEADYEKALKAYNDYHELTPKPQEDYDVGCFQIMGKLGLLKDAGGEEFEGEELENMVQVEIVDKNAEIAIQKGENRTNLYPTVEERDRNRIETRMKKLGETFYGKPLEELSFQERENLRNFKEDMMEVYTRGEDGKNMVMGASGELVRTMYHFYQKFCTMEYEENHVAQFFDQAQEQIKAGTKLDDIQFAVPDNGKLEDEFEEEIQGEPLSWGPEQ